MSEQIRVRSARGDTRTVLWETHPHHITARNPRGEVIIAGDDVVTVGLTAAVYRQLSAGQLEIVEGEVGTSGIKWIGRLAGYDDWSAAEAITRIEAAKLDDEERAALAEYEAENRNRVTVLRALRNDD
jgi:hypothetical protein